MFGYELVKHMSQLELELELELEHASQNDT